MAQESPTRLKLLPVLSAIEAAGLVIAVLCLTGFAWLAKGLLRPELQSFDQLVLLWLYQRHHPWLDQFMLGVTWLGEQNVLLAISGLTVLSLAVLRRWFLLAGFAIAAGGATALNFVLKDAFARVRPALWERIVDVQDYSFPSGHAMLSLVIYGMLAYLLVKLVPRLQFLALWGSVILIGLIGLSRLYLGVHWPTDVLAGYAAGVVWLVTCVLSVELGGRWLPLQDHHQFAAEAEP